ncbi:MAG: hypothetical protein ABI444_13115 [Candidatus Kapaibacterium sp.]|jgi:hypothetical protein
MTSRKTMTTRVPRNNLRFVALSVLIASSLAGIGCHPDRFIIGKDDPIQCRTFAPVRYTEHGNNAILLHDSSNVAMSFLGMTEFNLEMNVRLLKGEGFRFLMRPVVEEEVRDSGLVLVLTRSGSHVDSAGKQIIDLSHVHLKRDTAALLTFYSENNYLRVTLGCDTIVTRFTPMNESDDVVFEPLPKSEISVFAVDWQRFDNR